MKKKKTNKKINKTTQSFETNTPSPLRIRKYFHIRKETFSKQKNTFVNAVRWLNGVTLAEQSYKCVEWNSNKFKQFPFVDWVRGSTLAMDSNSFFWANLGMNGSPLSWPGNSTIQALILRAFQAFWRKSACGRPTTIKRNWNVLCDFFDENRHFDICTDRREHGIRRDIYDIYKTILIGFCSVHTFTELFLITFHIKDVNLDELTVSIAYGIQHFLGIIKVYILLVHRRRNGRGFEIEWWILFSFKNFEEIRIPWVGQADQGGTALSGQWSKVSGNKLGGWWVHGWFSSRFVKDLNDTVNLSDKIGFIYWFAVLITISCGCVTGVYVTLTSKFDMRTICIEKFGLYDDVLIQNDIKVPSAMSFALEVANNYASLEEEPEPYVLMEYLENELRWVCRHIFNRWSFILPSASWTSQPSSRTSNVCDRRSLFRTTSGCLSTERTHDFSR